jgi:diguanylate cyclase (GGDEF)-like protein/PAS domain S-box-containing protein
MKNKKTRSQQMQINSEYYKKVLDTLYDGIYFIDQDKKIIYWNKGAEKHTGYKQSEVIGRHCWDNILMHVNDQGIQLCEELCPISKTIADGRLREVEVYLKHKEGHRVPVSMRIAPIKDSDGKVVVAVEIFSENSPKFTLSHRLWELQNIALLDPLTGIGNRRYIEINLKARLEELRRYGWPFGVLFIDIDHFKNINDIYGHDIGDNLLTILGKTLLNSLRSFDIFGRWGGEEFIAIITNVKEDQLYFIANRMRLLAEQSNISMGSDIIRSTISIGATLARIDDKVNTLVKRADQLIYQSKTSGRNCISINN